MKITFIKDCPPIIESGNSAYTAGIQADLRLGADLVSMGYAVEGWGDAPKVTAVSPPEPIAPTPKPEGGNHIIDATAAAIRLAAKHGIDLVALDGQGTGENGRILVSDVRALVDGD